jgi:hypothetical protein
MSKYHAKKTEYDGIVFDSRREANRYAQLKILEEAGEISNLELQVKFVLIPAQRIDGKVVERECSYKADFVYDEIDERGNKHKVVEDVKGVKTEAYKIKKKMLLYVHGVQIREV